MQTIRYITSTYIHMRAHMFSACELKILIYTRLYPAERRLLNAVCCVLMSALDRERQVQGYFRFYVHISYVCVCVCLSPRSCTYANVPLPHADGARPYNATRNLFVFLYFCVRNYLNSVCVIYIVNNSFIGESLRECGGGTMVPPTQS